MAQSYVTVLFLFSSIFPLIFCNLNKIVDLTWDFSNETIYWTGITPFSYTKIEKVENARGFWYSKNEFCAGEHGGTHFDAPYHFYRHGWTVDEVPIERLVAKGATLDLSKHNTNLLLPQHLQEWVQNNSDFENNTVLLIRFGWSKHWPNRTKYLGVNAAGNLNFPGISEDAARWIARSGKIVGVGLDTASLDPGSSTDFRAHRVLSEAQIYGLENVKLLEELPATGFNVIALPMKLKHGTGGPVRILAVPKTIL